MIVLIDDDKFIRYGWDSRAKKRGIEFLSFESIDDFIFNKDLIPLESEIYIDSDLKQLLSGENLAKSIFDIGYKNLFITSGFSDIELDKFPWIKGIISKIPPF